MVKMIVAIGKDGAIGKNGDLIWKIPADLQRFKSLTLGHPVIMGRKTWDSLPKKPLPGRRNIILTRKKDFLAEGAETVNSVEEALNLTKGQEPFIIGGAEVYKAFMTYIDEMNLTIVEEESENADAFLDIDVSQGWVIKEESETETTPDGIKYKYITYQKSL